MKGIILAGGAGSRLYPVTKVINKQLLPVYDKPMIYYPLSVLMLAGIREVLLISRPQDQGMYESLLGDGSQYGISLSYAPQPNPNGLAEAFIIGRDFVDGSSCALVLGDNLFYGQGLQNVLAEAQLRTQGATIFAYSVKDPERYGIVNFDQSGKALDVEEKPKRPKSRFAIPGLYFFDGRAADFAARVKPSARGELEITDLIRFYLERDELYVKRLGRGHAWLDTGTHSSLMQASAFVQAIEERQGLKIACLEEIAFRKGFIDKAGLISAAEQAGESSYGEYLYGLLDGDDSQKND
ncbi:glucose-1-phosphate thymidylyltransferase RfbA [bacterium]|nr:glucose-1-phosphate thymidylyltransferase RfbA [bacterium]